MYFSKEQIEEIKYGISILKVMEHFGFEPDAYNKFICPNPRHNDTKPSASYIKQGGKDGKMINCLYCHGCGEVIDVFKAYSYLSGLDLRDDFTQICEELLKLDSLKKVKPFDKEKYITNKKEKDEDAFNQRINMSKSIHQLHLEKNYTLDRYFQARCINYLNIKKMLEDNDIEIRHNFYKEKGINSIYVVDNKNKVIYQRQIEDYLKNKESAPSQKYITGASNYIYLQTNKEHKADCLMIFEGFYDMVSYISNNIDIKDRYKIDYICLNSINNYKNHKDELDSLFKEYKLILSLLDNDEGGNSLNKTLKEELKEKLMFIKPLYKDWNEQIIKEKEAMKKEKEKLQRLYNKWN